MKNLSFFTVLSMGLLILSSCERTSSQTLENMKTASSFFQDKYHSIMSKLNNVYPADNETAQTEKADFVPLDDNSGKSLFEQADVAISQSNFLPGEAGSPVPGIEHFNQPENELNKIFKKVFFATDDHIVREKADLETIHNIAEFLKDNPTYFISIEGHCDERASSAYNLALGTRRSNQIRVLLIKLGVNYNRLFTISYGKERPLSLLHSRESWDQNRRGEFKIFKK